MREITKGERAITGDERDANEREREQEETNKKEALHRPGPPPPASVLVRLRDFVLLASTLFTTPNLP